MKKIQLVLFGLFFPLICFASGDVHTDLVQRLINFILFMAILVYFIFPKIRAIFVRYSLDIQKKMDAQLEHIKKIKSEKDEVKKRLTSTESRAKEIISRAKEQAKIITKKANKDTKLHIKNLENAMESSMQFELNVAKKEVVQEILEEVINSKDIKLSNVDCLNIITKRIAQ